LVASEKIHFPSKTFAIDFAHEVRNRLNAIRLHSDLIGRGDSLCAKSSHHLNIVQQEVMKLEEFVAQVLRNTVNGSLLSAAQPLNRKER
jgi:signal transduction histidine kinase